MGLVRFLICLDQPLYYSGQTLSGRLVIAVDKPMKFKAVYVKYSGEGSICWTKTRCRPIIGGCKLETVKYKNSEQYVALKHLVFGNDEEESLLPTGEHFLPFNFQLPMDTPSSFEGVHGSVRYSVKAKITRSTWKSDHRAGHPLTLMSVCDLNHIADAAVPVQVKKVKSFWGQSRSLTMYLLLPVYGYAPGQIIPVTVLLVNESTVRVKSLNVFLLQHTTYYAPRLSKTTTVYLYKNRIPVRDDSSNFTEAVIPVVIPLVQASNLELCNIIDMSYELHVEAEVRACCHKNLKIKTEIIVGNVPLANYDTLCNTARGLLDSLIADTVILNE